MSENFNNNGSGSEPNGNDFNQNQLLNDVVSGVEKAPKKKTGLKVAAIGVGAAAVIAGGGVAAYNLSDYVKNQVKLATLEPAEYYAWVNEETASEVAEKMSESYKTALDKAEKGQSSDVVLKYEPSKDVKDLILEEVEETDYTSIIEDAESIEIGVSADVKGTEMLEKIYASYNGEKLVSAEIARDMENFAYFMRVPEFKEQWIGIELGNLLEEELDASVGTSTLVEAYMDVLTDPGEFLSPDELSELITKYTAVWNESIDDVELEKKEEVEIGDITAEYTVITAEIDEEKIVEIGKAFVEEIADDDTIKEIITERIGAVSEDEYDEAIEEAIKQIEETLDEGDFGDSTMELITYVDGTGTIRGIEFATDADDEETNIRFVVGHEKDEIAGEFVCIENGEEIMNCQLNGEVNGKTYSGDIEITVADTDEDYDDFDFDDEYYYDDEESDDEDEDEKKSESDKMTITVEFTDFEIVDEEKGYFNCDLAVVVPELDEPVALSFESDGKSQDIIYDVKIDDTDYGKVTLSMSTDDKTDISLPSSDDAFMIDVEADEVNFEEYATEEDVQKFIEEFLKKLGVSDEDAATIAESAISSLSVNDDYDDYDYDDDYDFDDDYDYEFDDDYDYEFDDDYDYDFDDDYDYDFDDDYDYDFDDDYDFDYDYSDNDNPDAANSVDAGELQAYVNVWDESWEAEYWGMSGESLSYNAKVADITGNGQYTVSVTADTDGYRYATTGSVDDASVLPYGIDLLAVGIDDTYDYPNLVITIDSLKFDGVEVPVTGSTYTDNSDGFMTTGVIYCDWYTLPESEYTISDGNEANATLTAIDGESIEEWTTIEITFTVSGI